MKAALLVHHDLIPPENVDEESLDWEKVPWSTEYDVLKCLKQLKYNVEVIGIDDSLKPIRTCIKEFKPRIFFNLLEEFRGEAVFDQNVVSYLELMDVAYTGCNPKGLILARDKALSKKILAYHKIKSPKFQVFPRNQPHRKVRLKEFPLIVKCLNEEASLGISQASVVKNEKDLRERVSFLHEHFKTDAIVEEFVSGTEYFVGVLGNYRLQVLPPWQLFFDKSQNPDDEFYSTSAKFDMKYRHRKGISTGESNVDLETTKRLQSVAKRAYKVLGLNGYARIDMRIDNDGNIFVLEANPNPDISEFDDFAESAKAAGIKYGELLKKIIKLGRQWNPVAGAKSPVAQ